MSAFNIKNLTSDLAISLIEGLDSIEEAAKHYQGCQGSLPHLFWHKNEKNPKIFQNQLVRCPTGPSKDNLV